MHTPGIMGKMIGPGLRLKNQGRQPLQSDTLCAAIPRRREAGYATAAGPGSLAFPDGSMSASGLRREAARGRLVIERIAGKDYTTLANIER
jgi:hypothetical protein